MLNKSWNELFSIYNKNRTYPNSNAHIIEKNKFELIQFYMNKIQDSRVHWFFTQAIECVEMDLYLPAISSLLNGIECSIKTKILLKKSDFIPDKLETYHVFNHKLINTAKDLNLPIGELCMPRESDFAEKLESKKPNLKTVEIVRLRNNICHGNIFEFVNKEYDTNAFFTPDLLKDLYLDILNISGNWVEKAYE